jgi:pimeloyl-ACP methyl ester carboxylesterase
MKYERLSDVVLCGHSYGGFVISGVAEQMASAIRSVLFLDAFVPRSGETVLDLTSPAVRENVSAALLRGDLGIPPRPAEAFGVNEADRPWVDSLCVAQPIGTFGQKSMLTGARERIARKAYVRAKTYANPGFDRALGELKSDSSWHTYEVAGGHDVMVDNPQRLTEILLEVAS